MNKKLEEIRKRSDSVLGDYPAKCKQLKLSLAERDAEAEAAKQTLDAAETLDEYDQAAEVLRRAELSRKFATDALRKLETSPRMDEREYLGHLATCRDIVGKAVKEYQEKTAALMEQLKVVREVYMDTVAEVNDTLMLLDGAANVLQSKYPNREVKRVNGPTSSKPDTSAWLKYALRYEGYTACRLATACKPEESTQKKYRVTPDADRDSVLLQAWTACQKGFPRRIV